MSEADSSPEEWVSTLSLEEQKTQSPTLSLEKTQTLSPEDLTQATTTTGTPTYDETEPVEQKSYLEQHTPSILASMEVVPDEQQLPETKMPETLCQIFSQSVVPFFLGGCGSISAGLLLTFANKDLDLLKEVPQFLVLMPPLQGLRGNLDMTFSSRMTTLAHVGAFEKQGLLKKVWRNAAVAQALSIFVCFIANLIALFIVNVSPEYSPGNSTSNSTSNFTINSTTKEPKYTPPDTTGSFLFLTSSSIISMGVNCWICVILLFSIVYCTWKHKYNPDNIVAPLGASVSDLLTIGSMLAVCSALRETTEYKTYVPSIIIIVLAVCSIPIWIYLAWKDDSAVKTAQQQCLTLVFAAMVSCGAGYLQSRGALRFPNYPAYQTLISGLAGNRGAVLASRISSYLEVRKESELPWRDRAWPFYYYASKCPEAKIAKLLLCTALPFQLFFVGVSTLLSYFLRDIVETDFRFFIGYAIVVVIQQSVILYLAQLLVFSMWTLGVDPDIHAIPLLTSAADFFGCGLLYILFIALYEAFGCVKAI